MKLCQLGLISAMSSTSFNAMRSRLFITEIFKSWQIQTHPIDFELRNSVTSIRMDLNRVEFIYRLTAFNSVTLASFNFSRDLPVSVLTGTVQKSSLQA